MGFPDSFLWGGDISAAQAEGAWDEDGKAPVEVDYLVGADRRSSRFAHVLREDGSRGRFEPLGNPPSSGDRMVFSDDAVYPNHKGVDFYHRWKGDLDLLHEMGFRALNLTVSWARIFPTGIAEGPNENGVAYYRAILDRCHELGIEPIVTLYKYDMPFFYVQRWGGWSNRRLIDEFVSFATYCIEQYGDVVRYWITFNELNILTSALDRPAATGANAQRVFEEMHHQLIASARVVRRGHEIDPSARIGCMCAGAMGYALTPDPRDELAIRRFKREKLYYASDTMVRGAYPPYAPAVWRRWGVSLDIDERDRRDLRQGRVDFLAFSYYSSNCVTVHTDGAGRTGGNVFGGAKNPYLVETAWGWPVDPIGLRIFLNELNDRYDSKPLLIVENGLGAEDTPVEEDGVVRVHDGYRIDYLRSHIANMRDAIDEGVNLLGYTVWSCIDLISNSTGELRKRYGLIYVDAADDGTPRGTYERYRKDSFFWYRDVIASNGENLG